MDRDTLMFVSNVLFQKPANIIIDSIIFSCLHTHLYLYVIMLHVISKLK